MTVDGDCSADTTLKGREKAVGLCRSNFVVRKRKELELFLRFTISFSPQGLLLIIRTTLLQALSAPCCWIHAHNKIIMPKVYQFKWFYEGIFQSVYSRSNSLIRKMVPGPSNFINILSTNCHADHYKVKCDFKKKTIIKVYLPTNLLLLSQ